MNIASILLQNADSKPDDLAIRHRSGHLSHGQFAAMVAKAAAGLISSDVRATDVVAILIEDPLEHWLATMAVAHMGATVFCVSKSMSGTQRELLLSRTHCGWLLSDERKVFSGLRQVNWSDIRNVKDNGSLAPAIVDANKPWIYVSGSGSTGQPKILPVTHEQQLHRANLARKWAPYDDTDVLVSLVSMHFYAAKQRFLEAMVIGSGTFVGEVGRVDYQPEVSDNSVNIIYGTVVHLERLLGSLPEDENQCLNKLKALMIGGSTVSMNLRDKIKQKVTDNLYVLWGTNESHTATITKPSEVFLTPHSVGHLFPGFSIKIVDGNGQSVPAGIDGELRLASPTIIHGYLGDEDATKKAFHDQWFHTGDLGHLTTDGQLVHRGRVDDMMIVGGVNVYPAEVEECLLAVDGVLDAIVKPLPHVQVQDLPVALVVKGSGAKFNAKSLAEKVWDQVGRHALHDVVFVSRIPRNEQGKVQGEVVEQIFKKKMEKTPSSPKKIGSLIKRVESKSSNTISFAFNLSNSADNDSIINWIEVLDENLHNEAKASKSEAFSDEGNQWLHSTLNLVKCLMQILRFPVFEVLNVRSCLPVTGSLGRWKAVCDKPDAKIIPLVVVEGVLKAAFKLAAWSATTSPNSDKDRARFFEIIESEVIRKLAKFSPKGKSTFEILRVANRLGIPYFPLPGGAFQLGMGSKGRKIDRSTTDNDSALGMRWSQNKHLTGQLLTQGGLPAPQHLATKTLAQAKQASEHLGFPLVIKPADLERGEGVNVDVDEGDLEGAFDEALKRSPGKTVLIEQQVDGVCHRLFIFGDELLYAVRRLPIGIYADGKSNIKDLVNIECEDQKRLPPWKRSGIRPLDKLAIQMLSRNGWTEDSVPEKGQFVALRRIETTAWGGVDEDVTTVVHPDNVKAAVDASKLFGLHIAGVDIISSNIEQPWHTNGAIINEVNFAPLLGGADISRSKIPNFLRKLIEGDGRIPIHIYVGGAQAYKKAEKKWKRLLGSGLRSVLVSSERQLMLKDRAYNMPTSSLHSRCNALIISLSIDALVLVVQDDEFMQSGLPFDRIDSLNIEDGAIVSYADKIPLNEEQTTKFLEFLKSWKRVQ